MLTQGTINMNPSSGFENLNNISFQNLISLAISFILIITAIILFFVIIGGGVAVILSGGKADSQGAQRGRSAITAGIVGLLIVFGAWAIMTLLESFFGVNLLSFTLP
jgi:hypothetical protein